MDNENSMILDALVSSLATSLSLAESAGMDIHFTSELNHLLSTAIYNLNETKENNKQCN